MILHALFMFLLVIK